MPVSWLPAHRPAWAQWRIPDREALWAVRISEDVMAVSASGELVRLGIGATEVLHPLLNSHLGQASDGSVLKLSTSWQTNLAAALAELALVRSELLTALRTSSDLGAAASGTHPWAEDVSTGRRSGYGQALGADSFTWGLRVAVLCPSPHVAIQAFDSLVPHVPLLLALSANSPYWQGRASALASTRTALRARLAQHGLPRTFGTFDAYIETIEALVRTRVIAGPGALGWDVQLLPEEGAIEISVMDAQTRVADIGGIAALVQCLVRLYAEREAPAPFAIPEILEANRVLAARMGMRAQLADPGGAFAQPARDELAGSLRTATDPGYARQQSAAGAGLAGLVAQLSSEFSEGNVHYAAA